MRETILVTSLALVAAITVVVPASMQIIPTAYAATGSSSSAITEGACSNGTFADNLVASVASSCGPNSSGSAAGSIAICKGNNGDLSIAFDGTCTTST